MNPTGSSIERAMMCPASFALPQARSTGDAAIQGTKNHDGIEADIVDGLTSRHAVVRKALEGATKVEVEAAYALDVVAETVRFIGYRIGRNYGTLEPNEVALTIDAIVHKPGEIQVWDWKSRKRATPAKTNWQLRAGAVATMLVDCQAMVWGGIGYLDNDDADCAPFDEWDVAPFFEDMRGMLARIEKAKSAKTHEVHSGPWCDYCPAMAHCPAHTRLALSMLGELDSIRSEVAFMSPEQVSKAWDLKKRIETILETVDASLRLRIQQGVIPRPNNKRLAMVECERSGFDMAKAKARLVELGEKLKDYEKKIQYTQIKEIKHNA